MSLPIRIPVQGYEAQNSLVSAPFFLNIGGWLNTQAAPYRAVLGLCEWWTFWAGSIRPKRIRSVLISPSIA